MSYCGEVEVRKSSLCPAAPDVSAESRIMNGVEGLRCMDQCFVSYVVSFGQILKMGELTMLDRARTLLRYAIAGPVLGRCPICETRTVFIKTGPYLRDQLLCCRCKSIARWRALI